MLLKYIVIEYLSIVAYIQKFNAIIFNNKTEYKIDCNQLDELKKLFKSFFSKHKIVNDKMVSIRNQIGAHREAIDPVIVNKLWEEIEPKIVIGPLNQIPQLFNFLKDLDIYVWTRTKEEGTIELTFPFRIN